MQWIRDRCLKNSFDKSPRSVALMQAYCNAPYVVQKIQKCCRDTKYESERRGVESELKCIGFIVVCAHCSKWSSEAFVLLWRVQTKQSFVPKMRWIIHLCVAIYPLKSFEFLSQKFSSALHNYDEEGFCAKLVKFRIVLAGYNYFFGKSLEWIKWIGIWNWISDIWLPSPCWCCYTSSTFSFLKNL